MKVLVISVSTSYWADIPEPGMENVRELSQA